MLTLWLFLKYLPQLARDSAASYRDYEEGRFARAQRTALERTREPPPLVGRVLPTDRPSEELEHHQNPQDAGSTRAELRILIREDSDLQRLTPERVRQLARLLDALYGAERRRLPRALRFAQKYVLEVVLRIGTRERSG